MEDVFSEDRKLISSHAFGWIRIACRPKDAGFSGKWVLDKTQASADGPANLETRIKQDGSEVSIESTFKEPENGVVPLLYLGVMTTRMHLSCDGTRAAESDRPVSNGVEDNTEW